MPPIIIAEFRDFANCCLFKSSVDRHHMIVMSPAPRKLLSVSSPPPPPKPRVAITRKIGAYQILSVCLYTSMFLLDEDLQSVQVDPSVSLSISVLRDLGNSVLIQTFGRQKLHSRPYGMEHSSRRANPSPTTYIVLSDSEKDQGGPDAVRFPPFLSLPKHKYQSDICCFNIVCFKPSIDCSHPPVPLPPGNIRSVTLLP